MSAPRAHSVSPGGPAIRVVFAARHDAPLVHRLVCEAFLEYEGVLQPASGALSETVEDVGNAIANGGAVLAWSGDIAVGTARFSLRADEVYVERVAVAPAYRGASIATLMMQHIEAHARTLGVERSAVRVRMSLPRNIALYQRLGYAIVKVEPHRKGGDEVATLLKKLT